MSRIVFRKMSDPIVEVEAVPFTSCNSGDHPLLPPEDCGRTWYRVGPKSVALIGAPLEYWLAHEKEFADFIVRYPDGRLEVWGAWRFDRFFRPVLVGEPKGSPPVDAVQV